MAAVELALVMTVFTVLLFGVIEMGRMLWVWNAAVETTRFGARMAVVCDIGDADIQARMRERMPDLSAAQIVVEYLPAACTSANCKEVRVRLQNYTHDTIIPFVPLSVTLPPFSTSLRKEFMQSADNPVCS